jgi:class 3 adenylate cyclase
VRLTRSILAIADISGYTGFIKRREIALLHAEEVINELLTAMLDGAEHPLALNKLEGDAALMFVETGADPGAAARDVLAQISRMFRAFSARIELLKLARRHCNCNACANIGGLTLKAFLHEGEVVVKRLRQFEELAGEDVILIHRMLKNTVPGSEYVLMSDAFHALLGGALADCASHEEHAEGLGSHKVWTLHPNAPALAALA